MRWPHARCGISKWGGMGIHSQIGKQFDNDTHLGWHEHGLMRQPLAAQLQFLDDFRIFIQIVALQVIQQLPPAAGHFD
jgi:hypothetical protein